MPTSWIVISIPYAYPPSALFSQVPIRLITLSTFRPPVYLCIQTHCIFCMLLAHEVGREPAHTICYAHEVRVYSTVYEYYIVF